jgi:hypothetical protein
MQIMRPGFNDGGSASIVVEMFSLPEVYSEFPTPENAAHDEYHYHNAATCPDCGQGMIRLGSCLHCPGCGYSSCGM